MSSLVNIVPLTAFLAESGEQVSVEQVKLNSIVGVKAGETIPIDGVVVDGECDVDEKTLTGESFPVPKHKDSTVWAGTTNLNGYISVKTSALAEDCAVARMAKLVEDAQNNKSKTQRYIDKCAKYYTPVIVAISACLAIVPMALRVHNQKEWYCLALVVLVSACPCALVLSTPVAMCCALSKAAASGLLFKGAEYIETLAKIKIMAFDKTGTLTRGEFEVTEFRSLIDGLSLNTLLYWVSSVESKSGHPMAAALVDYAQSNSVELKPDRVEQFQNFPGEGIYGKIDGMQIYVGNRKISSRAGCPSVPEIDGDNFQGKSVGYIFLGSSPAGLFSLSDVCRTGVKDAMKELKLMGIKTVMLTGDCYAAAKHVQDELGGALGEFQAELLPEDKANIVKGFQKEAPTAMIGDGLNDAPALATADIGISMGISGSALANETGHVILMTNDIGRIPKALRLARRARRKIIENMIISIVTKVAIVALAIAGYPLVWAAVLADTGTCLLVIMNSMLLLRRGTHTHGGKGCTSSHSHKNIASCCESANAPQLCCSDIESQKHCTSRSCSSEVYVPRYQPASSGLNNKQCHGSIEIKGCHSPPHSQYCSSKSKSIGNKNCSHSIPKNSCHSVMSSSPQCHPVDSCTSTKCSSVSNKVSCGSYTIPQSAVSCSKSCGNRKCSDKNRSHSHADHQTDTLKICGKTKCSDTILNVSHHSHANADSHCSKSPTPACPASILGSRSCGNSMCPDSAIEHGSHSHDSNPVYEEKEQGSLDFVQEDSDSHHDHCHGFLDEEHHHTKSAKEGVHCHSTSQRCSPDLVDKKKCAQTCLTEKEHNHSHPDEAHDSCATQDCCFPVQGHGETESIKESSCKHEAEDHCGSHSKSSPKDQEVANLVRKCCKYRACHEVRSGCRKHATECGPAVRSTINILRDNHLHCSGRKVCSPLEKRHTGLCCKSFRKECCAKNNHFGGGLSEIVIE